MSKLIPSSAETLDLPHIGKVIVYRDRGEWLAVRPNFSDPRQSPVGAGATPGEAVAELVALEG
jgi:hypothetical protein